MSQTGKIIFDASDADLATLEGDAEDYHGEMLNIKELRETFWNDLRSIDLTTREGVDTQEDEPEDLHDNFAPFDAGEEDDEDHNQEPDLYAEYNEPQESFRFTTSSAEANGSDDRAFSYFNPNLIRSWAGPAFWKPLRPKTQEQQLQGNLEAAEDDDDNEPLGFGDLYGDSADIPFGIADVDDYQGLSYGDQLIELPKKVKASFMHYAKAPKRVDVRRLKDNLWQNLQPEEPGRARGVSTMRALNLTIVTKIRDVHIVGDGEEV
ncbi:hypothetical protein HDU96_010052 [Phlyctochytrium bullatum]|nr:hypothetical protein HDU96_010052 [Phlyctochytrium bullatum]